jgi:hypothetical protein
MILGTLFVCLGVECTIMRKEFDTPEICIAEAEALVLEYETKAPNLTHISYTCEPLGEDA